MCGDETAFVVDSMLGRLAKWLRIMGYDAHYQKRYDLEEIKLLIEEGKRLVTRKKQWAALFPSAIFIHSDHVGEQLRELKGHGLLAHGPSPFSRCIRCNVVLIETDVVTASQCVPEYVFYEAGGKIKQCPTCKRCYWKGTHRERMEKQLRLWGVPLE